MGRINYRSNAIRAAKDLFYGEDVITSIKAAKSDAEISKIMLDARTRPPQRAKKSRAISRCLSSTTFTWSM